MNIDSLALPGVRGLRPYQPGKPLAELEREYGIQDAVKLASNENPLGPSPLAVLAIRAELEQVHRYPEGNGHILRTALAKKLNISPDQITLGNGSNEILELVARTFVSSEHDVIYSRHAFAIYPLLTQAIGARGVEVPAQDWGHDLAAMAAAISSRTRLVFLANPNNPTGSWFSRDALVEFLQRIPDSLVVVLDEAYYEYVDEAGYPDSLALLSSFPNLLVSRTFSKIHGLAGLRIGYGIAHSKLAELLNRVRQPFNVSSVAQAAALAALGDEGHLERSRASNAAQRQRLYNLFDELNLAYLPSAGNFICFELTQPAQDVFESLLGQGVIVRPLANYAMPNHLRVTVGAEPETGRFIEALKHSLNTIQTVPTAQ